MSLPRFPVWFWLTQVAPPSAKPLQTHISGGGGEVGGMGHRASSDLQQLPVRSAEQHLPPPWHGLGQASSNFVPPPSLCLFHDPCPESTDLSSDTNSCSLRICLSTRHLRTGLTDISRFLLNPARRTAQVLQQGLHFQDLPPPPHLRGAAAPSSPVNRDLC